MARQEGVVHSSEGVATSQGGVTRVGVVLLVIAVTQTLAFNVDVGSSVVHRAPKSSCPDDDCMFGFSVAQHKEQGRPWILVGAPTADAGQPGVFKGGAVYKCSTTDPSNCQLIPFDIKGNTMAAGGQQYDIKSRQWFGSIVKSSGEDGTILACAPRYVWFSRSLKRRETIGTCFTAKANFTDFFEYSPCRTRKWGYHRQGSCQAGLGAAIAQNGEQVFIGAVGSWYWQGQMYSINTSHPRQNPGRAKPAKAQGQVFSVNLNLLRHQRKTEEGAPKDDDSYLGYSVTTGEFNGDGDNKDVAVGMPRGANLTGKVVLYDSNLNNLNNLTGDQIGAYFGYSLASCDINGDGLDDLIIGSPMRTDYSIMGKFETGRVYVVYQDKNHKFGHSFDSLDGENHKARFGLSLASIGNINLDGITDTNSKGYQDFVVGAPYDGPEQRGAVYIYLGSQDGVMKKPSQVIFASDVGSEIRTFGFSVAGGMDLDNNKYPDLLVGAYDSGHAVHMRAAPVAHMIATINFDKANKQINLENQQCTLRDRRTRVPCVGVTVTLRYTGIGVANRMGLDLEYILDAKKEKHGQKRMFFFTSPTPNNIDENESYQKSTEFLLKDREFVKYFKVYIPGSNIHDKLTSLDLQFKYSLATGGVVDSRGGQLGAVLGHGDHMVMGSLNIQKECGVDNICIPSLSIKTKPIESYLMGTGKKLELAIEINNSGEDAFNTVLQVQIPKGVKYVNANSSEAGVSILCSAPNAGNNHTIQCEVGNPLRAETKVITHIFLKPSMENSEEPLSDFEFAILAKSSNPEAEGNGQDNFMHFEVPIKVETEFSLRGISKPPQVEYNISVPLPQTYEYEDQLGEEVTHIYHVTNKGPSEISESQVYILWPSFTDKQEHLLYLLGLTYETEKGQYATCKEVLNVNPLKVLLVGDSGYASAQMGSQGSSSQGSFSSSSSSSRGGSSYSSSSSSSRSSSSSSSRISSSSSSSSYEGTGGRGSIGYEEDDGSQLGTVFGAAQGPGDYHGTMSKAELEREAGGAVFSGQGSRTQVENTRYGGRANYQPPKIIDGAEETRLIDSRVQTNAKSGGVLVSETSQTSGSSSSSQSVRGGGVRVSVNSGASAGSMRGSSHSTISPSPSGSSGKVIGGWKLLENGTYIRVYDRKTSSGSSRGPVSGGSRGGSSQSVGVSTSGGSISGSSRGSVSGIRSETVSVTGGSVSRGSVSGGSVSRGSVSGGSLSGGSLSGGSVSGGSMSSGSISGGSVSGSHSETVGVSGGSISSGSVSGGSLSGGVVSGGSVSGGSIAGGSISGSSSSSISGSSSGSVSGGGLSDGAQGSRDSGWVRLNNGTWTRQQSSWSSSSSSGSGLGYGSVHGSSGQGYGSVHGSSGQGYGSVHGSTQGLSGHGSYQGSSGLVGSGLEGSGLEGSDSRDAGSNDSGWTLLPNGTYVRKMSSWSRWSSSSGGHGGGGLEGTSHGSQSSSSSSISGYNEGSYFAGGRGTHLGSSSGEQITLGGGGHDNNAIEQVNLGDGGSMSGSNGGAGLIFSAARGPGDYHGTMSKAELEREAGGAIFTAQGGETKHQVESTRYQGSHAEGEANINSIDGGSYGGDASYSGGVSEEADSFYSSSESESSSDTMANHGGKWVWSEANNKWEWEEVASVSTGGSLDIVGTGDSGSTESPWTLLPNGTYIRKSSAWSSWSSSSSSPDGGAARGTVQGGAILAGGHGGYGSQASNSGGFGGYSNQDSDSGQGDSGWILLANGTYVRRQSTWNSSSSSGVTLSGDRVAGAGYGTGTVLSGDDVAAHLSSGILTPVGHDLSGHEHGDKGRNDTGWVTLEDGTMVKKTSSWASWSGVSHAGEEFNQDRLEDVQRQLEEKARQHLNSIPSNVEPGFEKSYRRNHRSNRKRQKRSSKEFEVALGGCEGKCTIIECTIGPLAMNKSVIFKVRSRLFTETQVNNYQEKVTITSKLITRVTKLPFRVRDEFLAHQSHSVTTTVIPSEPLERGIPWWVILLAVLGGILVLALIACLLYKFGFFKRKRPENSPETEPLNGHKSNGY